MLFFKNLLSYILAFPIFGILLMLGVPLEKEKWLKMMALNFTCFSFMGSLLLWGFFQKSTHSFQYIVKFGWLPTLNLNCTIGLDGISLFFIMLTTLLISLCLLASWNTMPINLKGFLIAFLFLDFFLMGAFCVLDLLLFYVFFESVMIPMFLIIGLWGSSERKILAAYYFFVRLVISIVY